MTEQLADAVAVLRERVDSVLSSMPVSAAARRSPENDVIVPMGALDVVLAALTDAEPVAWAIYGRVTGVLRYVVQSEDTAMELREHYDVVPLFPRGARS